MSKVIRCPESKVVDPNDRIPGRRDPWSQNLVESCCDGAHYGII